MAITLAKAIRSGRRKVRLVKRVANSGGFCLQKLLTDGLAASLSRRK
jgi:hypothetical protein